MTLHGSCLCKAVTYEADAIDGSIWDCLCQTCRKAHAADHNTAARVKREHFRVTSGAEALSAFESTPGKLRHFCSKCGSHIYAERPELPFVVLRAATLDDDPGIKPEELPGPMIDVCGTGGDRMDLFNISTTCMFVLAAGICIDFQLIATVILPEGKLPTILAALLFAAFVTQWFILPKINARGQK